MKIKKKLKSRRLELGMTMLDVAKKTGVSEATVSRWESGDIANMRRDKIISLAKALQVTPSFIMDDDSEQSNASDDYLILDNIGLRIKEQRTKLGYTLAQIADMLNVKEATVQRYESGEIKNLKHDTIMSLANILKCSPCYLMGWDGNDINIYSREAINIAEKVEKLNNTGKEKADSYITDLLDNPKYVADAHQIDTGYASIAADTGKNVRVKAPDIDTIIALNKDE